MKKNLILLATLCCGLSVFASDAYETEITNRVLNYAVADKESTHEKFRFTLSGFPQSAVMMQIVLPCGLEDVDSPACKWTPNRTYTSTSEVTNKACTIDVPFSWLLADKDVLNHRYQEDYVFYFRIAVTNWSRSYISGTYQWVCSTNWYDSRQTSDGHWNYGDRSDYDKNAAWDMKVQRIGILVRSRNEPIYHTNYTYSVTQHTYQVGFSPVTVPTNSLTCGSYPPTFKHTCTYAFTDGNTHDIEGYALVRTPHEWITYENRYEKAINNLYYQLGQWKNPRDSSQTIHHMQDNRLTSVPFYGYYYNSSYKKVWSKLYTISVSWSEVD